MKRRWLLGAGLVAVAAAAGFVAGHMQSAVAGRPVQAPTTHGSVAVTEPPLPASVDISAQEMRNMQLHMARAEIRPLLRLVPATGTIGYDELRLARVTAPARGRIEALDVVVGDRVRAGQRLALLDNFALSEARSRVATAQAELTQATAEASAAQASVVRATELVRTGGMAEGELQRRRAEAARAQAALRTRQAELQQWQDAEQRLMPTDVSATSNGSASVAVQGPRDAQGAIVAPFGGVVDSVGVAPGEIVDTSKQVFTVANLSTVWLQADLAESDLGAVRVGDAVNVHVDAYPDKVFHGRVTYIADRIDPQTGSARVRCEIPNPDGDLRVNMFANVTITAPLGRNGILVPSAALQTINGQDVVFIPTGPDRFVWRVVHIGSVSSNRTEITGGLAAGTAVVTDGSYWLKAALLRDTIPDEG